ncbi:hypothetical protein QQ045_004543 [Rhodiola kirilowii]
MEEQMGSRFLIGAEAAAAHRGKGNATLPHSVIKRDSTMHVLLEKDAELGREPRTPNIGHGVIDVGRTAFHPVKSLVVKSRRWGGTIEPAEGRNRDGPFADVPGALSTEVREDFADIRPDMASESYALGFYKIDPTEVFYSTQLSYAMVNLRPVVPGIKKGDVEAADQEEGIEVAWNQVKLGKLSDDSGDLRGVYSEVKLLKRFHIDHIIALYDFWKDEKQNT